MEKTEACYGVTEFPSSSGGPLLTIGELWTAIVALVPAGLSNRGSCPRPGPGGPEAPSDNPSDNPSDTSSDTSSDNPSDTPSDRPSDAPSATQPKSQ